MSHFSVLVIGPDVEAQLQPYHEYECTGTLDEYVVEVDITDKVIEPFNQPQKVLRLPTGKVMSRWDPAFYTGTPDDALAQKLGRKEFVMPAGAVELEMPADEARSHGIGYASLADCARDYFGSTIEKEGSFYNLTNPNKRWDWWVIGGRWTGHFRLKPHAPGTVGRPGLMTEACPPGYCDQAFKGDIDFAAMRNDAEVKARHFWKDTRRITNGAAWETWADTLIRYPDISKARIEYHDQPAIQLLKASNLKAYNWNIDDDLTLDEAIYVERRRNAAVPTYAFVRDGQWTERGKMGWWGISSDEISKVQWDSMFNQMVDDLPADTLLTVVDCHI